MIRSLAKGNALDYDRVLKIENSVVLAHQFAESTEAWAEYRYNKANERKKP